MLPEASSAPLVAGAGGRSGVGAATATALQSKVRGCDEKVVHAFSARHARCRIAGKSVEWVTIVGDLHAVGITDDSKLPGKLVVLVGVPPGESSGGQTLAQLPVQFEVVAVSGLK